MEKGSRNDLKLKHIVSKLSREIKTAAQSSSLSLSEAVYLFSSEIISVEFHSEVTAAQLRSVKRDVSFHTHTEG